MVMRVDVVDAALDQAYGSDRDRVRKIALAPSEALFDERLAAELATEQHLALLCGRYEGFDERVLDNRWTRRSRSAATCSPEESCPRW